MQPSFGQNDLHGIVLDSVTNDPIPFASISFSDQIKTISDLDGKFHLKNISEPTAVLKVEVVGYPTREFKVQIPNDSLKLTLIIPDDESSFIIRGKPRDTLFYETGEIQKINYRGHDKEEFYPNGQIKFKSVNGSTRSWHENGQLRSQSILKNNHLRYESTWYSNGQKESEGTVYWGHNERKNEGEWFKNDDWNYWTKKGKKK